MNTTEILQVADLLDGAVGAAAEFYDRYLEKIGAILSGDTKLLVIVMPAAAYDHDDWRRAAVRDLARQYAPRRVVVVAGGDEAALAATATFLESAPGVTGQLLKLDR